MFSIHATSTISKILTADDTLTPLHFTYFHLTTCCSFVYQMNSAHSNEMFINHKKVTMAMARFK
jgi:hypothetical protein